MRSTVSHRSSTQRINLLQKTQQRRPGSRDGVTYVLVLGTTLMVAVMGLSGLIAARSQSRNARQLQAVASASDLALSAVARGRMLIKADQNWRTTYASGLWSAEQQLGEGFFNWKVIDASTGGSVLHSGIESLSDTSSVKIIGKGRVGNVIHLTSVEVAVTKSPYDALKSALHAQGAVTLTSGSGYTMAAINGPLSSNTSIANGVAFTGNLEAPLITNTGTVSGTQSLTTAAKSPPPDSVWDYYRPLATTIPWDAGTTNQYFFYDSGKSQYKIKTNILTPTLSNFVTPVTSPAAGVYYVSVPGGLGKLQFDWVRVNATILFDVQGPGTTIHFGGHILWTPARPDFPMTIIRNAQTVELDAQGNTGALTESGGSYNVGSSANYNPPGFPYNGTEDTDTIDSYESRLFGVTHVMGGTGGTPTATTIFTLLRSTGSIIVPGTLSYPGGNTSNGVNATMTWDSSLLTNPPVGYYSMTLTPLAGTWKQELIVP
jgi:hypothetical protein